MKDYVLLRPLAIDSFFPMTILDKKLLVLKNWPGAAHKIDRILS